MPDGERPASYLLVHGWQHHQPPGHWLVWLAAQLRSRGRSVAYPQLPDPDEPRLDVWLGQLRGQLQAASAPSVVVCHSLGCLLWLQHAAGAGANAAVQRVVLVAPPDRSLLDQAPDLVPFFGPVRADQLAATSRAAVRLVCSEDDPYCPSGAATAYGAALGLDVDLLPGRAHLDPDAGFGPWPAMLEWCLDPRTRLGAPEG
jgi:predicted alpha/beta hydrolase family esterase